MKSFLIKNKKPICKWGNLPDETYFKGKVPEGYSLAICPSQGDIIVDVDIKEHVNGLLNIPTYILEELENTLHYTTKSGGKHFWLHYTGNKELINRSTELGLDLRTHKGYVVWYHYQTIQNVYDQIKNTSEEVNDWLEKLFTHKEKIMEKRIQEAFIKALKEKNEDAKNAINALKTSITNVKKLTGTEVLADNDIQKIISKEIIKRVESSVIYEKNNRLDLANIEKAQAEILKQFLPEEMTSEEIRIKCIAIFSSLPDTLPIAAKRGKTIGEFNKQFSGQSDLNILKKIVDELP